MLKKTTLLILVASLCWLAIGSTIRADTIFLPFHFGGQRRANLLTNPALDPTSRMPEFKVCAARLEPLEIA